MNKIKRKSLLYKSQVEYADFCINHVEGCAHGCTFPCYAMLMAIRFGKVKNYSEWIKPRLVENSLKLLDKEIPKYKNQIKFVHMCFTTDPFMYKYPEIQDMSLKIIEKLSSNRIKTNVLTKGAYPKNLTENRFYIKNEYGITLVSLDEKFRRVYEKGTASYINRIKALKYLHKKGLKTWVSMEPFPTPNMVEQDLKKILGKISFVDKIVFGKLNYNKIVSKYKNSSKFYDECSKVVLDFCKKNKIACHIKFGTQQFYNPSTAKIFK